MHFAILRLLLFFMTEEKEKNQVWWYPAVAAFSRVSAWIIGPVIAALIIGKFLDRTFHTEPWIFIGFTAFAFFVSMFKLVQEASLQIKNIGNQSPTDNKEKTKK